MRTVRQGLTVGLLLAAGVPTAAYAQLGSRVSVVFSGTIDSNQPGSGQFAGQVKNPVTIGGVPVPAGSSALAKLVPSAGGPRTWSIALVSVSANGQNLAVSSTSAMPGRVP